ncbi:CPBP family intramembrane metalloprotease [Paramixta manurensis]|uniref:CPBP family intramembrane metalloprotease n=1 Tax=Paramixta manurensis TaxID=2740817 RepID=A0A6M8U8Q5_9GAMM|nr:CPBP family intramembrane metalloprotease [Erwiniaceae bacterium PD-1]
MWYLLAVSLLILAFHRPAAIGLLVITLAIAITQQVLQPPAIAGLAVLAAVIAIRRQCHATRWLAAITEGILVLGAIALMLHLMPGFNNTRIVTAVQAGPHSAPFTFYYNLDKALIPFVLLACLPTLFRTDAQPPRYKVWWLLLLLAIPVLLLIATLAGGLAIEPHFPRWLWPFALANLFFVSLAEEALFRGYLQQRLTGWVGSLPALLLTSLLFGMAHIAGGSLLVLFATLAGLIYGLAWQWSGKLWVATWVHFAFNLTHLLLFTYPVLQR